MELRAEMTSSLEASGLPQMMRSFRFSVALGWSLPHVPIGFWKCTEARKPRVKTHTCAPSAQIASICVYEEEEEEKEEEEKEGDPK